MSILRPPIIHVIHDDHDQPSYRRLVRDAVRQHDLGRVIELAYDMAEKLDSAQQQVDHIIDVMRQERQANPACRNISEHVQPAVLLVSTPGGDD